MTTPSNPIAGVGMAMDEAVEIVLDLASGGEPTDSAHYCTLCSGLTGQHTRDCPWQRAWEWAAHSLPRPEQP